MSGLAGTGDDFPYPVNPVDPAEIRFQQVTG